MRRSNKTSSTKVTRNEKTQPAEKTVQPVEKTLEEVAMEAILSPFWAQRLTAQPDRWKSRSEPVATDYPVLVRVR